ncbi:AAA family ATPase, partial [candidate division WOR-3 bacterium]|nr:AAA family ATPase [candidate division WOR-3 bacterium]
MSTKFVCQNCGASSPKWLGRCPACSEYNTMVEEIIEKKISRKKSRLLIPQHLSEIPFSKEGRCTIGISELDRVLGGGFVKGSLILLGGDPGIGKSTLMLQISGLVADLGRKVFYVNGEESAYQVRMRAERLGIDGTGIDILSSTELESVLECAEENKPDFMIIDSIQTIYK